MATPADIATLRDPAETETETVAVAELRVGDVVDYNGVFASGAAEQKAPELWRLTDRGTGAISIKGRVLGAPERWQVGPYSVVVAIVDDAELRGTACIFDPEAPADFDILLVRLKQ